MILLASGYLLFQTANGESVPVSTESISVELVGGACHTVDPELVHNAASAVVHYFKHDLQRDIVSAREFAGQLEKVLHGFGFALHSVDDPAAMPGDDLRALAHEAGGELLFFPAIRHALRGQLRHASSTIRFRGLRGCVKQLTGARRWSPRCEALRDQIVEYLRQCLSAEPVPAPRTLVVE